MLKAPLAIQAFSNEALKEKNVNDVTNLITSIPGASIAQDSGAGIRSYNIRGVGSGEEDILTHRPEPPTVGVTPAVGAPKSLESIET